MFKPDLEKAKEPEVKLPTSIGSQKKQENSRKNICFIDYAKAFDNVHHNKLWKILKETGIPDHLAYLLRNLYAGQEATVKTGHGLAIINSAVMNIGVHVSLSILVSSVCMPSNEIAGSE